MREIKCRGYSKELQKWIVGSYLDGYIINGVIEANEEYIIIERWEPVGVDTIGQYTGFKDKKGTEIYEGDLCKVSGEEPYSNDYFVTDHNWEFIMYVDFEDGAFQLREVKDKHMSIYYIETQDMDIEVIGNIYEGEYLITKEGENDRE